MKGSPMKQHHDALRHAQLTGREHWRLAAACRFVDPELFFPVSDSGPSLMQATEAKAICTECPVRRQCLSFALRTRQVHGIWGGLTERERHVPAAEWN
jgi:WhiB family transcriptional regulator, redox-sensing transcriptional regulator